MRSLTVVQLQFRPVVATNRLVPVTAPDANLAVLDEPYSTRTEQTPVPRSQFPVGSLAPYGGSAGQSKLQQQLAVADASFQNLVAQVEDDTSAMDWTPTKPSLTPRIFTPPTQPENPYSFSSFYGKLPPAPAAPLHPLHAARLPPKQPTFIRPSKEKRDHFANMFDSDSLSPAKGFVPSQTHGEMEVQAGKLNLPSQDTGLEHILNRAFSLNDDPEVDDQPSAAGRNAGPTTSDSSMQQAPLSQEFVPVPAQGQPWISSTFWFIVLGVGGATLSTYLMK
jgi:hypothetical protein